MAVIFEKYTSPRITNGAGRSIERLYGITGEPDEEAALALLESTAPSASGGLPRQTVRLEPVGPDVWDGEALYSRHPPPSGGSTPPETGQSVISFDTTGGTQRITQSRETISSHAVSGFPPDFKRAIAVTSDSVEGIDIVVPVFKFSETHYIDSAEVDEAFKINLFHLTGKVNNAAFRGFEAGEVLFLGATGSRRGGPEGDDFEISFGFAASPNATGLTVGDMTGIDKKGWEYLWVRYGDAVDEDAGVAIKIPLYAYVERVYDDDDFSTIGI